MIGRSASARWAMTTTLGGRRTSGWAVSNATCSSTNQTVLHTTPRTTHGTTPPIIGIRQARGGQGLPFRGWTGEAMVRPMTMETRCYKVFFPNYSKRNRLKILSYRHHAENGKKMFGFSGSFAHATVCGGNCAFTLNIVSTLIKNSSRDDRPSISA